MRKWFRCYITLYKMSHSRKLSEGYTRLLSTVQYWWLDTDLLISHFKGSLNWFSTTCNWKRSHSVQCIIAMKKIDKYFLNIIFECAKKEIKQREILFSFLLLLFLLIFYPSSSSPPSSVSLFCCIDDFKQRNRMFRIWK